MSRMGSVTQYNIILVGRDGCVAYGDTPDNLTVTTTSQLYHWADVTMTDTGVIVMNSTGYIAYGRDVTDLKIVSASTGNTSTSLTVVTAYPGGNVAIGTQGLSPYPLLYGVPPVFSRYEYLPSTTAAITTLKDGKVAAMSYRGSTAYGVPPAMTTVTNSTGTFFYGIKQLPNVAMFAAGTNGWMALALSVSSAYTFSQPHGSEYIWRCVTSKASGTNANRAVIGGDGGYIAYGQTPATTVLTQVGTSTYYGADCMSDGTYVLVGGNGTVTYGTDVAALTTYSTGAHTWNAVVTKK